MDEWEAIIQFPTYTTSVTNWSGSRAGLLKYCKKHFPVGVVLTTQNITKNEQPKRHIERP
jgi:hypothetical protein